MAYWWLSCIIALSAGFVTAVVLNSFGRNKRLSFCLSTLATILLAFIIAHLFLTPYYKVLTFERQLKLQPSFQFIAAQDPATFQAFIIAARPLVLKQKYPNQIRFIAEKVAQDVFIKALTKAPNDAIVTYLKAASDLYSKLLSQNPQWVLVFEYPQKFNTIYLSDINTETFQAELNQFNTAKAAIIMTAIKDPQPTPNYYAINYLINAIHSYLKMEYGSANVNFAFNQPTNTRLNPTTGAKIIIDYYQQVLKQDPSDAGKIIRFTAKS